MTADLSDLIAEVCACGYQAGAAAVSFFRWLKRLLWDMRSNGPMDDYPS